MSKESIDRDQYGSLVDQGWLQMQVILDKEMPVKRKRRVFWWPLAAAGLVLILIAGGYSLGLFSPKSPASDQPLALRIPADEGPKQGEGVTTDAMARDTDQTGSPSTEAATGNATDQSTQRDANPRLLDTERSDLAKEVAVADARTVTSRGSESKIEGGDQVAEAHRSIADHPAIEEAAVAREGSIEALGTEDAQAAGVEAVATDTKEDQPHEVLTPEVRSQTANPVVERLGIGRSALALASLPVPSGGALGFQYGLPLVPHPPTPSVPSIEVRPASRKFVFAVSAGAVVDSRLQELSWEAGADLRYPIASWMSIGTGLHFWQVRDRNTFVQEDVATVGLREPARIDVHDMFSGVVDPSQVLYVGGTERLRYARVPLTLTFLPDRRWQPSIGVSQLWLLENAVNELDLAAQLSGNQMPTVMPSRRLSDGLVHKKNTLLELGITYQALDHLSANLTYAHGLRSYLTVAHPSDIARLHRQIRLSVQYQFGRSPHDSDR